MNLNLGMGGLGAVDGFQMVKQSYGLRVLVFQHSVVKKHILDQLYLGDSPGFMGLNDLCSEVS